MQEYGNNMQKSDFENFWKSSLKSWQSILNLNLQKVLLGAISFIW
jgi:uncharacterized iron-regulated protein